MNFSVDGHDVYAYTGARAFVPEQPHVLLVHGAGALCLIALVPGMAGAALAFLLALVASGSRRRDPYGTGAIWKLSLILLACITGFVAHHGLDGGQGHVLMIHLCGK